MRPRGRFVDLTSGVTGSPVLNQLLMGCEWYFAGWCGNTNWFLLCCSKFSKSYHDGWGWGTCPMRRPQGSGVYSAWKWQNKDVHSRAWHQNKKIWVGMRKTIFTIASALSSGAGYPLNVFKTHTDKALSNLVWAHSCPCFDQYIVPKCFRGQCQYEQLYDSVAIHKTAEGFALVAI